MPDFFKLLTYPPIEPDGPSRKFFALFHPVRARWIKVNSSALGIARHLMSGKTPEEAADLLASQYGIPKETALADVRGVFERLCQEGFLDSTLPLGREPHLKKVYIHLTDRCNLACRHCYLGEATKEIPEDIPFDLVRILVDALETGTGHLTLSGGEPFLHPEFEKILAYASGRVSVRVLTNGTLLNEKRARVLAESGAYVQVSLDGSCPEIHDKNRGPGSFARTLAAIRLLRRTGLIDKTSISATVLATNLDDLEKIVKLAEEEGVPFVRFLPLRRMGSSEANWDSLGAEAEVEGYVKAHETVTRLVRTGKTRVDAACGLSGFMLAPPEGNEDEIWCPMGTLLTVTPRGDVYPCPLLETESFRLGNIHEESPSEILGSRAMAGICRALSQRRTAISQCAACAFRNFCQGGCPGQAFVHRGTIWEADKHCQARKAAYGKALDELLTA